jgi:hypothetical protein
MALAWLSDGGALWAYPHAQVWLLVWREDDRWRWEMIDEPYLVNDGEAPTCAEAQADAENFWRCGLSIAAVEEWLATSAPFGKAIAVGNAEEELELIEYATHYRRGTVCPTPESIFY